MKRIRYRHIDIEIVDKPWFGPKARGKELLLKSNRHEVEVSPLDFCAYLENTFEAVFPRVEHIRFHKCTFRDKNPWEQRFAICNVNPDYNAREILHLAGAQVVEDTGWYPLVMGRRIRPHRAKEPSWIATREDLRGIFSSEFGELQSIRAVDEDGQSCAILLELSGGSVLMDLGFNFHITEATNLPSFAILSHTHKDHSGGLRRAIDLGVPIILSESVFWQLQTLLDLSGEDRQHLLPIRPPIKIRARDGTTFTFLPGAHSPGSIMTLITTSKNDQLLFPGDYCLANAYYDQSTDELLRLFSRKANSKWMLVDGTFLGHEPDSSGMTLEALTKTLETCHKASRSTLFLAESLEYLYQVYIWLFEQFYTGKKSQLRRHLVVDDKLVALLETTFEPFILRQHTSYDPFMEAVLGQSMHNYLETVRLYPITSIESGNGPPEPYDVLSRASEGQRIVNLLDIKPETFVVGRVRQSASSYLLKKEISSANLTYIEGPDFSFHSSTSEVVRLIDDAIRRRIYPIVFHNYPERISRVLKKYRFEDYEFDSLRSDAIRLD